ncbi:MAG: 1-(5-phosphoribosyl)-5-[(5-phosphoribosylamino)methylideneamino]imidazole-4-carboxamide isomerase [Paludibacteraceae bacterium]
MIELIPAIDIINGKCVRLTQGDYAQKTVYNENPVDIAKAFEGVGIKRLHVVDLDGAKAQHIVNYSVLEHITSHTSLIVDFGGGLKSDNDLRIAFECGASMITGGSIAVKNREIFSGWIQKFGNEKLILGADVKNEKIAVSGWIENTDLELIPFIDIYKKQGLNKVICTDISKDGMLEGPSLVLYKKIIRTFPDLYLIASGGVSSMHDIKQLEEAEIPAVIFGKAFYEGRITLKELEKYSI